MLIPTKVSVFRQVSRKHKNTCDRKARRNNPFFRIKTCAVIIHPQKGKVKFRNLESSQRSLDSAFNCQIFNIQGDS